jgi:hypothetical protein
MLTIAASCIKLLVETYYNEDNIDSKQANFVLDVFDFFTTIIFSIEAFLKIIKMGFVLP